MTTRTKSLRCHRPELCILVVLLKIGSLPSPGVAQDVESQKAKAQAVSLMESVFKTLGELKTGHYEARCRLQSFRSQLSDQASNLWDKAHVDPELADVRWKINTEMEISIDSRFEFAGNKLRIERTDSGRRYESRLPENLSLNLFSEYADGRRRFEWLSTPTQTVQVIDATKKGPPRVGVQGPIPIDAATSKMRMYTAFRPLLDVRSLSIQSYSQFGLLDESFDTARERILNGMKPIAVQTTPRQTVQTEWKIDSKAAAAFVHTFELDPSQANLPVSREIRSDDGRVEWSRTTWKQVEGTWVPMTYQAMRRRPGSSVDLLMMLFRWTSVNEPIAPVEFTIDGLEIPADHIQFDPSSPSGTSRHGF